MNQAPAQHVRVAGSDCKHMGASKEPLSPLVSLWKTRACPVDMVPELGQGQPAPRVPNPEADLPGDPLAVHL